MRSPAGTAAQSNVRPLVDVDEPTAITDEVERSFDGIGRDFPGNGNASGKARASLETRTVGRILSASFVSGISYSGMRLWMRPLMTS